MTDTAPPPVHPKYLTAPVKSTKMPGGIPYIIGNEAAERFSFYGMKAILVVFMTQYLFVMGDTVGVRMGDARANEIFHYFVGAVYLLPIAGAFLSDIFLGKYLTIMLLSVVYCAGHAALAFMGYVGDAQIWLFAGLGLIAVGSGGIKPCVTAHVGDQFGRTNRHLMEKVFNFFYFSINFGSFISTLLTPVLLHNYGPHWAFGVPGVLMGLATLMFWMGRKKFIHIPAGGWSFLDEFFSWEGVLAILKLAVIYVFVAVFWALFDQTGSSWIQQAQDMDREWLGMTWLPSQLQAINPIMILVYIPIFTFGIYPAIGKVFKLTPIRKISIGLFIMAIGFAIVSVVQSWIDAGETPSIGWQVVAYAILTASEVMVSITCLEFSYTQAPKKMKSVVLATFLVSVSLGNVFTATVNRFIQSPSQSDVLAQAVSQIEEYRKDHESIPAQEEWSEVASDPESVRYTPLPTGRYTLRLPGSDGEFDTADDVVAEYTKSGKTASVETLGLEPLRAAVDKVEDFVEESERLPSQEEGEALLSVLQDEWGESLMFRRINRLSARVVSLGPDSTLYTADDLSITVSVPDPGKEDDEEGPWLIERKKELGVTNGADDSDPEDVATDEELAIGGLVKLEGASYFWFFTQVMLGTAILFVVVGYLYRPKEYIHEEVEDIVAEGDLHG